MRAACAPQAPPPSPDQLDPASLAPPPALPPDLRPDAGHWDAAAGVVRGRDGGVAAWADVDREARPGLVMGARGRHRDRAARLELVGLPMGGGAGGTAASDAAASGAGASGAGGQLMAALRFDGRSGLSLDGETLPGWPSDLNGLDCDEQAVAPFTLVWVGRAAAPEAAEGAGGGGQRRRVGREQWLLGLNRPPHNTRQGVHWSTRNVSGAESSGEGGADAAELFCVRAAYAPEPWIVLCLLCSSSQATLGGTQPW
jgi:hypothetical protein